MTLFDSCCADIETNYDQLGHRLGWRFLSCPKVNLNPAASLAFISLNPGGSYDPPDHPHESQENGSAYLVESWEGRLAGQSKLQVQVGTMFKMLADRIGDRDYKALMNRTLMGYFIPFRSPNFDSLENQAASVEFGEHLWTRIFEQIAPKTIITMDTQTFKRVRKVIKGRRPDVSERHTQLPTGWGNYMADIVRYGSTENGVTLARLPHLSRFTIFTSKKCQHDVQQIMDAIVNVHLGGFLSHQARLGCLNAPST
jgi:hypothetical protein